MKTKCLPSGKILGALALPLALLLPGARARAAESVLATSAPGLVNFQGRLQQNGQPQNGVFTMTFNLYNVATGGSPLATFGPQSVTVTQGVFGTSLSISTASLSGAAFKYLEVVVGSQVLSPREEIHSVPYALVAKSIEDGVSIGTISVSGNIFSSGTLRAATLTSITGLTGITVTAPTFFTGGNVGIGTALPTAKLHIAGVAGVDGIRFPDGTFQTSAAAGGSFVSKVGDTMIGQLTVNGSSITVVDSSAADSFSLAVTSAPNRGVYHLYVATSGLVGIGTSSPAGALDVTRVAAAGVTQASVLNPDNAGSSRLLASSSLGALSMEAQQPGSAFGGAGDARAASGGTLYWSGAAAPLSLAAPGSYLRFFTGGDTFLFERMRVDAQGRVGIGASAPANLLDVNGGVVLRSSLTVAGVALAPPVSAAGQGAVFFDTASGKFKVSQNGAAYVDLVGGGNFVSRTGDTMTGQLTVSGSSVTIVDGAATDSFSLAVTSAANRSVYHLVVTTSGLVGVGTTSPSAVLHVSSQTSSFTATPFLVSSGTAVGQELLVVKGNGSVGVGVASPGQTLHLRNNTAGGPTAIRFEQRAGGSFWDLLIATDGRFGFQNNGGFEAFTITSGNQVSVGALGGVNARLHVSSSSAVASDNILLVSSGGAVGQELFVVKGDGKTGVGTVSPADTLHVQGQVRISSATNLATQGCLRYNGPLTRLEFADDCATFGPLSGSSGGWTRLSLAGIVEVNNPADNVVIQSTLTVQGNAFSVGVTTFVVAGGGIGMGTASPFGRLEVNHPGSGNGTTAQGWASSGLASRSFNTNGFSGIGFQDSTGAEQAFAGFGNTTHSTWANRAVFGTNTTLDLELATNNLTRVVVLGNASPVAVEVRGDIRVGTSGTNGCLQRFDGTALAGVCSSDRRLKKDIRPLQGLLGKVAALKPSRYVWRADEFPERKLGGGPQMGLIAQEVEQVLPELVGKDDKGFKAVNYGIELQMLMLESIRELKAENDDLRERVRKLEERPRP